MGGGDLNLKKSWHPSTLRNIERVWKAEQKHEVEKQKIEQLQKELAEERAREEIHQFAENQGVIKKKEEKLDWMYQGPAAMVNRDEYLLGRKIDKTFETLQPIENGGESSKDEGAEDRSMFSCQNLSGTATVDLANKIREDPLFNIMKKEKEERKNLLTNPVKMKQLQQLLKSSLGVKKSKKNKKNKKKRHQESDSEEEQQKHQKHASSESDGEASSSRKMKKNSTKYKIADGDDYSSERKKWKYEAEEPPASERRYKNSHAAASERSHEQRKPRPSSNYRESEHYFSREAYHSSREAHHSSRESRQKYPSNHHSSKESSHYHKNKSYDSKSHNHHEDHDTKEEKKKRMSTEERERLLREMQENAVWREEQRKRNMQRYREEDEREEKSRIDTSDFLKPMLSKAAGKGSLENQIKQKIFTIQRSSRDMDKNFARRD